ncbi:uncharacterized protein LOC113593661 [Acinonyx jubatus]|uniref:Uncharacterized protein LOC113593661 n=1 Tax=Acinonyx jubatus TaxID=32536 RepID=A0A6J1XRL4_ACIJB|nr:uncharacterized protein LOC113593661 [Acinonyx jubatus]
MSPSFRKREMRCTPGHWRQLPLFLSCVYCQDQDECCLFALAKPTAQDGNSELMKCEPERQQVGAMETLPSVRCLDVPWRKSHSPRAGWLTCHIQKLHTLPHSEMKAWPRWSREGTLKGISLLKSGHSKPSPRLLLPLFRKFRIHGKNLKRKRMWNSMTLKKKQPSAPLHNHHPLLSNSAGKNHKVTFIDYLPSAGHYAKSFS